MMLNEYTKHNKILKELVIGTIVDFYIQQN